MEKPEKSSKPAWLGDIAPIGLAVLVVAAAALGFRLIYSTEKSVSPETIGNAQRDAFIKEHYPVDLTSANQPARNAPLPAATSR